MKCVTLAILIQHCAASQARNANASNPSGECFGICGKVDGDDASIFLQHGVARIHADVLQHSLLQGFFGAQNISHQSTSKRNTEEPNHVYDMYAGLVLATVSLVLFLMVRLLVDDMASLGLPITITGTSDRDGLLDNAKFLLIIIVMLTHYQGSFGFSREVLSAQWKAILKYTMCPLHTRTLCFISGIVSRKELKSEAILIRLLGPLFGFCFIVRPIFDRLSHQPDIGPLENLLAGEGVQWYLLALVWWRVLASLIRPFRPLMKMFTACALAAMANYVKTTFLCFHMITIFPIFIAGQLFPYDQAISKTKWRPFTAAVGLAIIVGIASIRALVPAVNLVVPLRWERVAGNGIVVDPDSMPLWWFRSLAGTSVEILKSVVFLVVVCPRARTFFTDLGAQSLYPYLLHIFVVPWLAKVTFSTPWLNDGMNVPFSLRVAAVSADILICAIVCAILASRPVRLVFGVIFEPTWIHKLYAEDGKPTNLGHEMSSDDHNESR